MGHSGDSNGELISNFQFKYFLGYLFMIKNFIPPVFPFTGRIITPFCVPAESYFEDQQNTPQFPLKFKPKKESPELMTTPA